MMLFLKSFYLFSCPISLYNIPFLFEFLIFIVSIFYLIFCCSNYFLKNNFIFYLYSYVRYFLLVITLLSIFLFISSKNIEFEFFFNNNLSNDFFSTFFKILILLSCYLSFYQYSFFILRHKKSWKSIVEFPFLFLGSILFLLLLLTVQDLFLMVLCIIGMSICLYALLASNSIFGRLSREACIKYFIMSALSSGLLLGGVKEIYLLCGSTNFTIINNFLIWKISNFSNIYEFYNFKIGLFFIFAGFLFKLSAAPSHFWSPEIYEGIPYSLMSFIVLPIKLAISVVFIKIFKSIFFINTLNSVINYIILNEIETFILFVIVLSMIIGGINALFEQKIKRFLAYSSINQIGFLFIGLLGYDSSFYGIQAFLYFIIIYVLNLSIFFLLIFWYTLNFPVYSSKTSLKFLNNRFVEFNYVSDFKNFFWIFKNLNFSKEILPFYAFWLLFVLVLFSLAGIPPLAGFFSKFYILLYAFKLKYWFIIFIGIIVSIISAYYYLRILKIAFFEMPKAISFSSATIDFSLNNEILTAVKNYSNICKQHASIFNFLILFVSLFFITFVFFDNFLINFTFKLTQSFFILGF